MKKYSIIFGIIAVFLTVGMVYAWYNHNDCYEDCSPTPTPSVSPTPTPSPSPSVKPCGDQEGEFDWNSQIVCPTPSPSPSVVPESTPEAQPSSNSSYSVASCNGIYPEAFQIISSNTVGIGKVHFTWINKGNVDYYVAAYGYVGQGLTFGIPHIDGNATDITIGNLESGKGINLQLTAFRGECTTKSNTFDPVVM